MLTQLVMTFTFSEYMSLYFWDCSVKNIYFLYTICVHNQNTVGSVNAQLHLFYALKMFKKSVIVG